MHFWDPEGWETSPCSLGLERKGGFTEVILRELRISYIVLDKVTAIIFRWDKVTAVVPPESETSSRRNLTVFHWIQDFRGWYLQADFTLLPSHPATNQDLS